ncbi:Protein of unknown function DUF2855 [Abortiporus biennis]
MSHFVVENQSLCVPRQSQSQGNNAVIAHSTFSTTLPDNHVLIQLDRFGFSANNITYQLLGEAPHYRYFDFHPAPESGAVNPKTYGLIPVWGFGTVLATSHPKVRKGDRVYGFFAPTKYLLLPVSTTDISKYAFYVPRPHLPEDRRPYNQIIRCANDPLYDPSPLAEDLTMLYRPLFWTSYWCEDWLYATKYRGATRILISSASSKTAFCLAYRIKKRILRENLDNIKVVGLTSQRNVDFTEQLGLYDDVLSYDDFERNPEFELESAVELWTYVDVSGNEELNKRVFSFFSSTGSSLKASIKLGMSNLSPGNSTTVDKRSPFSKSGADFASTTDMEAFFTPEWLAIRRKELSAAQIAEMQAEAWKELMVDGKDWVKIQRVNGPDEVLKAYDIVSKGKLGPDVGMIWSMWDEENDLKKAKVGEGKL